MNSVAGPIGVEAKDAVPALIVILKDTDAGARFFSAIALRNMGPAAKAAIPALIESMTDQDRCVRETVAAALTAIDPEAAKKAGVP